MTNDGRTPPPTGVLVNGQRRDVRADPDTALLYVLRNHLGLKGTRFGCGLGLCGACLVLVDGQVTYSCDTPVWASVRIRLMWHKPSCAMAATAEVETPSAAR